MATLRAIHCLPWTPDVILAHFAGLPAVIGLGMSWAMRRPLAVFAHARDIWVPWAPGLRALDRAEIVITCNTPVLKVLEQRPGPRAGRPRLCRHGLPAEAFSPAPWLDGEASTGGEGIKTRLSACGFRLSQPLVEAASGDADQPPLLLAAGRMVAKKGFDVWLDALAVLEGEGLSFRAELIGDGPLAKPLAAQAARLGLKNLRMRPALPPADFLERLRAAALYVHPARVDADGDRDGIPNAVLEAMAAGVPVAAADAGGLSEVVRPSAEDGPGGVGVGVGIGIETETPTGWLVPSNDAPALASAMRAALTAPSERRRRALSARALVAREFALPETAKRLSNQLFSREMSEH